MAEAEALARLPQSQAGGEGSSHLGSAWGPGQCWMPAAHWPFLRPPQKPGVRLAPTGQKLQPGLCPQTDYPLPLWSRKPGSPQCPQPPLRSPHFSLSPPCFHSLKSPWAQQTPTCWAGLPEGLFKTCTWSLCGSRALGGSPPPGGDEAQETRHPKLFSIHSRQTCRPPSHLSFPHFSVSLQTPVPGELLCILQDPTCTAPPSPPRGPLGASGRMGEGGCGLFFGRMGSHGQCHVGGERTLAPG